MAYITFQPKNYFNTLLYDGNGSTNARTGLGFEPDWIWIKNNTNDHDHYLFDQVRGATKYVRTNVGNAEGTASGVTSFDSDGFTLGNSDGMNENGRAFVAWNWRASGSQGSSNTDGSINTTYTSVSTTSGFSISQYTGTGSNATVGHGLGVAPEVVWIKRLTDASEGMYAYMKVIGAGNALSLSENIASAAAAPLFNSTDPTSSVFSVGTHGATNASSKSYIAYSFAPKKGFSKFGLYKGNGSTWGVFVNCGFKPAFVLVKKSNDSDNWVILDNKRDVSPNPRKLALFPNTSGAQSGDYLIDFLSNGFKIRSTTGSLNNSSSGGTYIYMAFAEEPLVASNGTPATAG